MSAALHPNANAEAVLGGTEFVRRHSVVPEDFGIARQTSCHAVHHIGVADLVALLIDQVARAHKVGGGHQVTVLFQKALCVNDCSGVVLNLGKNIGNGTRHALRDLLSGIDLRRGFVQPQELTGIEKALLSASF